MEVLALVISEVFKDNPWLDLYLMILTSEYSPSISYPLGLGLSTVNYLLISQGLL